MTLSNLKRKSAKVLRILLSIIFRLSKETLAKSKFNKINNNRKSYTQASKFNIENIIHIKNIFPKLSTKKVIEINNIVNNKMG